MFLSKSRSTELCVGIPVHGKPECKLFLQPTLAAVATALVAVAVADAIAVVAADAIAVVAADAVAVAAADALAVEQLAEQVAIVEALVADATIVVAEP